MCFYYQNLLCPNCLISPVMIEHYCRINNCQHIMAPLTHIYNHIQNSFRNCCSWCQYFHNFRHFYTSCINSSYHASVLAAYQKFLTDLLNSCQCCQGSCQNTNPNFGFTLNRCCTCYRMNRTSATVQCAMSPEKNSAVIQTCGSYQGSCSPKESCCYEILFPKSSCCSKEKYSIMSVKKCVAPKSNILCDCESLESLHRNIQISCNSSLESCAAQTSCCICRSQCVQTTNSVDKCQKEKDDLLCYYKAENNMLRRELRAFEACVKDKKLDSIIDFYKLENKILKKQLDQMKIRLSCLKTVIKENCESIRLTDVKKCQTSPKCLHKSVKFSDVCGCSLRGGGHIDSDSSRCLLYKCQKCHRNQQPVTSEVSDKTSSNLTFTTETNDSQTSECQVDIKKSMFHLHDEITMTSSQSFTVLSSVKKRGKGNVVFPKTEFAVHVYQDVNQ